jgi:hypothetical protein
MRETPTNWSIENYGKGVIVADYSGKRGKFGAAYAGRDGLWRDQPAGIDPFTDTQTAEAFAKAEVS